MLKINVNYIVPFICIVILGLFIPVFCSADDESSSGDYKTLQGKLAFTDLGYDNIYAFEMTIHIQSEMQDGEKIWITKFTDTNGDEIDPSSLESGDIVRITGKQLSKHEFTADAVMFIKKEGHSSTTTQSDDSSSRSYTQQSTSGSSETLHLVNGVWTNE